LGSISRSGVRKRPNVHCGYPLAELLDRDVIGRIPERVDGLHVRKLEHHDRTLVMFSFQHFHLCASGDKLSAKAGDERYDGLHVLLILLFVFYSVLDNEIGAIAESW